MKLLIRLLKWGCLLVIAGELFFLFLLNSSGHNIPKETNRATQRDIILALAFLFILIFLGRRHAKN